MKFLQIYLLIGCLFMISCSQNNIIEEPEPSGENGLELTLKKQQVVAFKSIEKNKQEIPLDESQIDEFFSTRVDAFIPVKIIIEKDSTVLVKASGLKESFKTFWESEKLYIQSDQEGIKKMLGETTEKGFLLHCAFYSNKVTRNDRSHQSLGQDYGLRDYASLVEDAQGYQLIWLEIDSYYKNSTIIF